MGKAIVYTFKNDTAWLNIRLEPSWLSEALTGGKFPYRHTPIAGGIGPLYISFEDNTFRLGPGRAKMDDEMVNQVLGYFSNIVDPNTVMKDVREGKNIIPND